MTCEVKRCSKPDAIRVIGVDLCDHHWDQHCDGLDLITKKGLLTFNSGVAVLVRDSKDRIQPFVVPSVNPLAEGS